MAFKLTVLLLAVFAVAAFALPVPSNVEDKEFFDVLPEEIKSFYSSMSDADVAVFSELLPQLDGKDDKQAYEIIKAKDPVLAERAKNLYQVVYGKINSLPEVPKKFMFDLLAAVETFNDARIKQVVAQAVGLPKEAKDAILTVFPTLRPILKV